MNIYYTATIALEQHTRQQSHIARQADQIDLVRVEKSHDFAFVLTLRGVILSREDKSLNTVLLGTAENIRL